MHSRGGLEFEVPIGIHMCLTIEDQGPSTRYCEGDQKDNATHEKALVDSSLHEAAQEECYRDFDQTDANHDDNRMEKPPVPEERIVFG